MSGHFAKYDSPIVRIGDSIVDVSRVCGAQICGDTNLLVHFESQEMLVSFETSKEQQEAFVLLCEKMIESNNGGKNSHPGGFLQRSIGNIWPR